MNELFSYISGVSNNLAQSYELDLTVFLIIYLISFLPFYGGYLLMIYGTTRKLRLKDIFSLNVLRGKLQWNNQVTSGLIIHLVGRIMPYVYIVAVGKNLPLLLVIIVWGIILLSLFISIYKIFTIKKYVLPDDIEILRKVHITNENDVKVLWRIYNDTFEPLNRLSPCRQSFDQEHFEEALSDTTVQKYLLNKKDFGYIGLSLITNDFKNTPWISGEYFKSKYPHEFDSKLIFYFMGIAVLNEFRGNKYSLALIEHVIDDLPKNVIIGFDHSVNINPRLHFFTSVIKQSRLIKRTHIDRQHYHIVEYK